MRLLRIAPLAFSTLLAASLASERIEIRLAQELGQSAGVVMHGANPAQSVIFTLARDRRVESARLVLRLRGSKELAAGSSFTAAVNGMPVGSLRLEHSGEAVLEAAIPTDALRDFNRLEFRAVLRTTSGICENPNDPALWVVVDSSTRMLFDIGEYLHPPGIEDFPAPLADPLDYRPADVRFVLTAQHSSADYAVAARIAGAIGDRLEYRTSRLAAVSQFDPQADAAQVLIGSPEELAALMATSPPVGGLAPSVAPPVGGLAPSVAPPLGAGEGRLRVVENSARPGRYLLLVEGRDAAARRRAVEKLPDSGGPRGLLPNGESFRLRDVPTLLSGTLSSDAEGPGVTVHGADPPAIAMILRAAAGEHFVPAEQAVRLEYAYGPQVDNTNSALEVRLNGKTLLGQALGRAQGSAEEVLEVMLPAEAMGEENRLEMRFHLYPKNGATCNAAGLSSDGGQLWATLLGSSRFSLPRDSYADLPDLATLRRGGYPFRDGPTLLVTKPSDATLLLNAAFLLGRLFGQSPPDVRFDSEITSGIRRDYHLITVAAGPSVAMNEAISPWNPQRLTLAIVVPPENPASLQDAVFMAGLSGAATRMDAARRIRTSRAASTSRFGEIAINRRVKYWVMDNVQWVILNSALLLIAGLFFLRYVRKHYFPPLPDQEETVAVP